MKVSDEREKDNILIIDKKKIDFERILPFLYNAQSYISLTIIKSLLNV